MRGLVGGRWEEWEEGKGWELGLVFKLKDCFNNDDDNNNNNEDEK